MSEKDNVLKKALQNEGKHWIGHAIVLLDKFLSKQNGEFFIEEFRDWALKNGLDEPKNPQGWGAFTNSASSKGAIVHIREDAAKSTKRTGHKLKVWRKA